MPDLRTKPEFAVIGIATRTSNTNEMQESQARIPALWGEYFAGNVSARVPNRSPEEATVAVYTDYESDHTGAYSLVVGRQVSSLDQVPQGMVGITVPAGSYLVFSAEGPVPEVVVDAWKRIWTYFEERPEYKRAYCSDFEVYRNDGTGLDIYIGVE